MSSPLSRFNKLKDFSSVAGPLGITHMLTLSQTTAALNLRIARFPHGPTLSFKVQRYCHSPAVRATQRRPFDSPAAYLTPPLVILNNFGSEASAHHVKLMKITFQNLFPPLNVHTVKLGDCRRAILFHFSKDKEEVEVRHYAVRAFPVGLNKGIKRLVQTKVPNLSKLEDISEYVQGVGVGAASDSELEDESSHVILPDKFSGRGNMKSQMSAIKLAELGPRMTLKLMKVERGFFEGDVMYHDYIQKPLEEQLALKKKAEEGKNLKKRRREEQEANVARKKGALEQKKQERKERYVQ